MNANSFGQLFKVHSFGESHGPAMGAIVEGCPSGVPLTGAEVQTELDRRRPGAGAHVSARQEPDQVEILSGVFEGKTIGTPIAMCVRNTNARSDDYKQPLDRRGHADDVWQAKFGHVDPRGGGRASGRETISRVMAGAVAKQVIAKLCPELNIKGFVRALGPFELNKLEREIFLASDQISDAFVARFPSEAQGEALSSALEDLRADANSWGGIAEVAIQNPPEGLGQPVFHKLKSDLAAALMGVGAVAAIEIGDGLHVSERDGYQFHKESPPSIYGGIRGGISTGETIFIRVHMKPTSSIDRVARLGRHDPCILIRAVPVLEAMAQLVICDHLLWRRLDRL